ncbi:WD repeat-containing protein, partial [Lentinula boryana]
SVSIHPYLNQHTIPSFSLLNRFQERALGNSLARTWDRVSVLGNNRDYGHAGCVNALHWAYGGELLLSAGDDTTVQIWKMDPTNTSNDYPFVCRTVIHTGHKANIFNTAMLPHSNRIVTVAGDKQVRVFDVGDNRGLSVLGQNVRQEYYASQLKTHTLRCHEDRVKRIATEESPDRFLTVSEASDGTVRQHDLRTPHVCRNHCPAPLLQVHHELSTLTTSSYYCVVAGDSPYGYLFDRRFTGRERNVKADGIVPCVRRFGRAKQRKTGRYSRDHITGARMSAENGHEVLLSYSADGVYLFSTLDDPENSGSPSSSSSSSIVSPNSKRRRVSLDSRSTSSSASSSPPTEDTAMEIDDGSAHVQQRDGDEGEGEDEVENENEEEDDKSEEDNEESLTEEESRGFYPWVDVVKPRRRFLGARNVKTVKDVNFLGPRDEYVTSGSDDGNFFVWHKSTGKLHGIYEGDGSVVNVIEGHPYLPLVAVSGIDHTVKLFAPIDVNRKSAFSQMSNAESIMKANRKGSRSRGIRRIDLMNLLASFRASNTNGEDNNPTADCVNQ